MRNDHSIDDFESIKIEGYKTVKVLLTYWVFYTDTYNVQPVLLYSKRF